jgi:hypothetical protein
MAASQPSLRSLPGFPPPSSWYWTPETIALVKARYGARFEAAEYEAALQAEQQDEPPPALGTDPRLRDVSGANVLQHLVVERGQWRSHGFVAIDGVLPYRLVDATAAALKAEVSSGGGAEHGTTCQCNAEWAASFPFDSDDSGALLNEISRSPRLLAVAAGLLGTTELELTRSDLRIRRGRRRTDDDAVSAPAEQEGEEKEGLHQDFFAQSLTVPPRSPLSQECVCMILYLTVQRTLTCIAAVGLLCSYLLLHRGSCSTVLRAACH